MTIKLTKSEQREIKQGRSQILQCAHCGKATYFGAMNFISLGIGNRKPSCSYNCNAALGQAE